MDSIINAMCGRTPLRRAVGAIVSKKDLPCKRHQATQKRHSALDGLEREVRRREAFGFGENVLDDQALIGIEIDHLIDADRCLIRGFDVGEGRRGRVPWLAGKCALAIVLSLPENGRQSNRCQLRMKLTQLSG